jgi:hypothetical protein
MVEEISVGGKAPRVGPIGRDIPVNGTTNRVLLVSDEAFKIFFHPSAKHNDFRRKPQLKPNPKGRGLGFKVHRQPTRSHSLTQFVSSYANWTETYSHRHLQEAHKSHR